MAEDLMCAAKGKFLSVIGRWVRSCSVLPVLLTWLLPTLCVAQAYYALRSPNPEEAGRFGWSVAGVGDVNLDNYDDFIVGAYDENPDPSPTSAGRAYVFSGWDRGLLHTLSSPNEEAFGHFGVAASGVGDVDGDGYPDFVVGAFTEDLDGGLSDAGRAYVFGGKSGLLLHTLESSNPEAEGYFGHAVSGAMDVNNDGFDDIVIGAYGEEPTGDPDESGAAYVFSGSDGNLLHCLRPVWAATWGHFGQAVSHAGDLNDDGYAEVIVGAPGEVHGGRVYVFDGKTGLVIDELTSPTPISYGSFGFSVSGAGDVDADGYRDIVVGAHDEHPGSSPFYTGRVHIFSGRDGSLIRSLQSPEEAASGFFGRDVCAAGDWNGDGFDDNLIAFPGQRRVYVFSGSSDSILATLDAPPGAGDGFGHAVSFAGEFDGDGCDDVLIAAPIHGKVFLPAEAMELTGYLSGGGLFLRWTPVVGTAHYWVYGAYNQRYFLPGSAPDYEHRLVVLNSNGTSWTSYDDIGDPEYDWTFLVVAADGSNQEIDMTNRFGEHDRYTFVP